MYEKEYIIAANEADKDNLDEVAKSCFLCEPECRLSILYQTGRKVIWRMPQLRQL